MDKAFNCVVLNSFYPLSKLKTLSIYNGVFASLNLRIMLMIIKRMIKDKM